MPPMRAANVVVVFVTLLAAAVAGQTIAAQAPTVGATSTAAAATAAVGVTAITASDAPPTPTPLVTPPPTPVLTPTPLLRSTPTGTPLAPTTLSSGSAVAADTRTAAPSSGTGGSSIWPFVGVLLIIAAVGVAGSVIMRRRSLGR